MKFEKFNGRRAAKVSVGKSGQISFNKAACDIYLIKSQTNAFLLFDAEEKIVGIQFVDASEEAGALEIKSPKNDSNRYINARLFFDYYGVPYGVVRNYTLEQSEDKILYFELKNIVQVKARAKKEKNKEKVKGA